MKSEKYVRDLIEYYKQELKKQEIRANTYEEEYQAVIQSSSWKLTHPLRKLIDAIKRNSAKPDVGIIIKNRIADEKFVDKKEVNASIQSGVKYESYFQLIMPEQMKLNTQSYVVYVTHELSRTGAPIVLLNALKAECGRGRMPILVSMEDGPLRQTVLELGIPVLINPDLCECPEQFMHLCEHSQYVFLNTFALARVAMLLGECKAPVYWWLHEGSYAFNAQIQTLNVSFHLPQNINVLYAGGYVKEVFEQTGYGFQGEILQFGVEIPSLPIQEMEIEKIKKCKKRFLFSGSFEERKGVDLIAEAICVLPEQLLDKCEFLFVGKHMDTKYVEIIHGLCEKYSNIRMLEVLPHEEMLKLYTQVDAVIVPSRDEPTSAVAVEAMAYACPVICSDATGISRFIHSNEDGIVFQSENVQELASIMIAILEGRVDIKKVGIRGEKIYENHFTLNVFIESFYKLID